MTRRELLSRAAALANEFLDGVGDRPVGAPMDAGTLRAAFGGPLPRRGQAPEEVLEALARAADPGIVATNGPRYFGFVVGGATPVTIAADWLASTWDQNAGLYVLSPAASVVEEVAGAWLREILGLPLHASVGFVTGAQMANFTGLAAARHETLRRAGWDVESQGLFGAPEIEVFVGAHAHVTIFTALQMLGLGRDRVHKVAADDEGRMIASDLERGLAAAGDGPKIVCAQAGNVNSGAFDPIASIADAAARHGAWLHVDGAFGLWAAASPLLRHRVAGVERADSWATDAHKWLNVPYDSGLVFCAHPDAHRASLMLVAPYLVKSTKRERDPTDWTPESSRRARGFAIWAALRALGADGVRDLVERCCALARRMAEGLASDPRVEVQNEVVLNQVLFRLRRGRDSSVEEDDAFTRAVVAATQSDGTCWIGGTTWRDRAAIRISVSTWSTTDEDADRSVAAILAAADRVRQA